MGVGNIIGLSETTFTALFISDAMSYPSILFNSLPSLLLNPFPIALFISTPNASAFFKAVSFVVGKNSGVGSV